MCYACFMNYPVYTLQKLDGDDNWLLTPKSNYNRLLTHGNLTSVVWRVTQEFHSHDFWEICLILRGNSTQRFLDRSEPMQPGSVYILRPHDVHCITPANPERPDNIRSSPHLHCDLYVPIDKMQRICSAIDERLYDRLLSRERPLSALHSVIVSHILCSVIERQRGTQSSYPSWLTQLIVDLDREDFMTKSVQEIIDTTGYNQSYLCRQFKRYTNQTLVEYIHKRKCNYSISLLPDLGISISQIAQRLHFTDESAYIRTFKQIYNTTPGQWRKKLS